MKILNSQRIISFTAKKFDQLGSKIENISQKLHAKNSALIHAKKVKNLKEIKKGAQESKAQTSKFMSKFIRGHYSDAKNKHLIKHAKQWLRVTKLSGYRLGAGLANHFARKHPRLRMLSNRLNSIIHSPGKLKKRLQEPHKFIHDEAQSVKNYHKHPLNIQLNHTQRNVNGLWNRMVHSRVTQLKHHTNRSHLMLPSYFEKHPKMAQKLGIMSGKKLIIRHDRHLADGNINLKTLLVNLRSRINPSGLYDAKNFHQLDNQGVFKKLTNYRIKQTINDSRNLSDALSQHQKTNYSKFLNQRPELAQRLGAYTGKFLQNHKRTLKLNGITTKVNPNKIYKIYHKNRMANVKSINPHELQQSANGLANSSWLTKMNRPKYMNLSSNLNTVALNKIDEHKFHNLANKATHSRVARRHYFKTINVKPHSKTLNKLSKQNRIHRYISSDIKHELRKIGQFRGSTTNGVNRHENMPTFKKIQSPLSQKRIKSLKLIPNGQKNTKYRKLQKAKLYHKGVSRN